MEIVNQLVEKYFELTPYQQKKFCKNARLRKIRGPIPKPKEKKKPKQKLEGKKQRSATYELTLEFNGLSFEDRLKFIQDNAKYKIKRKHGLD